MTFINTAEMFALIGALIVSGFGAAWILFWVSMIPYQLTRTLSDAS